ncbi:MAG TPA: iron chaperone [Telluria sp.]
MDVFTDFLAAVAVPAQRTRVRETLAWVAQQYPRLQPEIRWNQPMFTDHGSFIIGFSVAKHHMAVAPEPAAIARFSDQIRQAGYDHTKLLVRVRWDQPVDFSLLREIIEFNLADKENCSSFWRK